MQRNSGTPAERPVLALAAEPRSAPELKGAEQAEQGAELVRMSAAERAGNAVANAVRELWLHPDRLIHSMWNGRPESMAAHYAYMTSFAWVPKEMTGKKATAWKWAGIAYHFIAWPLKAFAKALDAAAGRPLLMLCLVVPVLVLVLLSVL